MTVEVMFRDGQTERYDVVEASDGMLVCTDVDNEKTIVSDLSPSFRPDTKPKVAYPLHRIKAVYDVEVDD